MTIERIDQQRFFIGRAAFTRLTSLAMRPSLAQLDLAPHLAPHLLLAPIGTGDHPGSAPSREELAFLTERGERGHEQGEHGHDAAPGRIGPGQGMGRSSNANGTA